MRQAKVVVVIGACLLLVANSAFADGGPNHQIKQTPPVKMGTSGGSANDISRFFCCGGTLGSLVLRDGVFCILSNNHILARSGSASTGEDDIQPGLIENGCSTSGVNIVGDFLGNVVPLGSANVDVGLSVARSGMVDTSGSILDIGVPCSTTQNATVGLAVMKSGRTTGFTTGTVQTVNTSVSIQYQKGCGQGKKFVISYTNQISTTNMSAGGDSGSLLLSNDGSPNPVGLLYAGSSSATIYNPVQDVVNAIQAGGHTFSFVGGNCGPVAAPADSTGPQIAVAQMIPEEAVNRVSQVKDRNEAALFGHPGVVGVGVGASDANANEAAVVVYVVSPNGHVPTSLPRQVENTQVRVILTDPFVAQ